MAFASESTLRLGSTGSWEYDLYLPLRFNDGRPVDVSVVQQVKSALVAEFGGLTHFPEENEGVWKLGGRTFRDKIVILRVLADDPARAREFFGNLKIELQRVLEQTDVLVVEREVLILG